MTAIECTMLPKCGAKTTGRHSCSDWAFAKPTDQESRSLRQAEMIKAINPETKVFVYRPD